MRQVIHQRLAQGDRRGVGVVQHDGQLGRAVRRNDRWGELFTHSRRGADDHLRAGRLTIGDALFGAHRARGNTVHMTARNVAEHIHGYPTAGTGCESRPRQAYERGRSWCGYHATTGRACIRGLCHNQTAGQVVLHTDFGQHTSGIGVVQVQRQGFRFASLGQRCTAAETCGIAAVQRFTVDGLVQHQWLEHVLGIGHRRVLDFLAIDGQALGGDVIDVLTLDTGRNVQFHVTRSRSATHRSWQGAFGDFHLGVVADIYHRVRPAGLHDIGTNRHIHVGRQVVGYSKVGGNHYRRVQEADAQTRTLTNANHCWVETFIQRDALAGLQRGFTKRGAVGLSLVTDQSI